MIFDIDDDPSQPHIYQSHWTPVPVPVRCLMRQVPKWPKARQPWNWKMPLRDEAMLILLCSSCSFDLWW